MMEQIGEAVGGMFGPQQPTRAKSDSERVECPDWTEGRVFLFTWDYSWRVPATYDAYLDSGWVRFMLAERARTWKRRGQMYWSPATRDEWERAYAEDNPALLNGRIGLGPRPATADQQDLEMKRMSLESFRELFEEVWYSFHNSPPKDEKVVAFYQHLGGVDAGTLARRAARIVATKGRFPSVAEWLGNEVFG